MDNKIFTILNNLIVRFSKDSVVISGELFRIGNEMPPIGWYEAISTTGYCVIVSRKFLERYLINYPHDNNPFAHADTITIELDPNLWGKCSDGSHNAWHTAIDLGLSDGEYILDLTCSQFGSQYVNKFIWDKKDWLKEFYRNDKRYLTLSESLRMIYNE